LTIDEWSKLSTDVGKVFTPAAPIGVHQLFAGRIAQVSQVVDVINQSGQHAMLFGERGVGKTSLANVIAVTFGSGKKSLAVRKNCDTSDTYSSLWEKIFREITLTRKINKIGFIDNVGCQTFTVLDQLAGNITPDSVRQALAGLSNQCTPIIIIDEFDRISDPGIRSTMADTIKMLSDHAIQATVIIVGVADSVDQLIKEHQSIERALVQIKMPRMSNNELKIIIDTGIKLLHMTIDDDAKDQIALLSQGLPHYTHLLGLHAAREAIKHKEKNINFGHVESAISNAIQQAQQTILTAYNKAITSPRRDNLFEQVLLACALSKTDDLGYFAAANVKDPLSKIMKKTYEIPSFSRHLNEFCDVERGPILDKIGKRRRYRFRFVNPLMQPFVVMHGFSYKSIDRPMLELSAKK
jgi:Cdc6-like AAA superfamily ATPase